MKEKKLELITKMFEGKEIRSVWNEIKEDYYFSVVDVIKVLTDNDYEKSRNYWKWLKNRLKSEGSELVSITNQLKLKSLKDGKYYLTDVLDTKGIFRLIESIPSPKAEPFKLWLSSLAKERIDEVFDPEIAINRSINYYRKRGYSDRRIKNRLIGILNRNKLTDTWKNHGINEGIEFAILTNVIYKTWSCMTAREYKDYKGLKKESLRDNMTDIEIALTDLGEVATRELTNELNPDGIEQNKNISIMGGEVAKVARDNLESKLNKKIISNKNNLNYKYIDYEKLIQTK